MKTIAALALLGFASQTQAIECFKEAEVAIADSTDNKGEKL